MAGAVVTSWLPVCWTHPGTLWSQMGSSEPHEVLGSPLGWNELGASRLLTRVTGTLERLFWMQVLLHRKISLVSHLTSGNVEIARGIPEWYWRWVPPVPERKSSPDEDSLLVEWSAGDQNLMCPRLSGFPCMVSIFSLACLWRGKSSYFRRACEMKLPKDPESMRAGTEMKWRGVSSCTVSSGRVDIAGSNWRVLTAGRREGHTRIKCRRTLQ